MLPSTARTHRRVLRALAAGLRHPVRRAADRGLRRKPGGAGRTRHARRRPRHPQKETGAQSAPSSSIEEIAAAVGCTAHVDIQADELREGGCETGQGAYRMATFAAEQGQRSWLDEARMYGGTYLVGSRWVVTGPSEEALAALRGHIGGTVEAGAAHTGHE